MKKINKLKNTMKNVKIGENKLGDIVQKVPSVTTQDLINKINEYADILTNLVDRIETVESDNKEIKKMIKKLKEKDIK